MDAAITLSELKSELAKGQDEVHTWYSAAHG
jgi:hypothetical protein